jgi:hypothetical protein
LDESFSDPLHNFAFTVVGPVPKELDLEKHIFDHSNTQKQILNQVYIVSKHTVQTNLSEVFISSVFREREIRGEVCERFFEGEED